MSKNNIVVPEAKDALERFKMEAAAEVGVNLKQGYNGDLTSRQAGSVGGQMVKKMIEAYETDCHRGRVELNQDRIMYELAEQQNAINQLSSEVNYVTYYR